MIVEPTFSGLQVEESVDPIESDSSMVSGGLTTRDVEQTVQAENPKQVKAQAPPRNTETALKLVTDKRKTERSLEPNRVVVTIPGDVPTEFYQDIINGLFAMFQDATGKANRDSPIAPFKIEGSYQLGNIKKVVRDFLDGTASNVPATPEGVALDEALSNVKFSVGRLPGGGRPLFEFFKSETAAEIIASSKVPASDNTQIIMWSVVAILAIIILK